jgi:hypothetical protein
MPAAGQHAAEFNSQNSEDLIKVRRKNEITSQPTNSLHGLNKSNARTKRCQKQLNCYVYATLSVTERLMREDL